MKRESYIETLTRKGEFEKLKLYKEKVKRYQNSRWKSLKENPEKLQEHYEKQNAWRNENKWSGYASYHRSKLKEPERWLLKQARTRAKDKNLEFDLVLEDIKIPQRCPIMDEILQYIPHAYSDYSPSIDRVDSSRGYTKDNIQIISTIANRMKWNATKEQLLTFCQGVLSLEGRLGSC